MAGETILIVEDRRENIVHLANNVLKPSGYQVLTAMDGRRGLKRALLDRPELIIMDLNMPKMDGLEVLAALQEREINIPVILTTFYGSDQVAQQAMQLGAVDYVIKPFTVTEMLSAVEKALASRTPPPVEPDDEPVDEPDEVIPLTRQVERWMRDMNILTRVGKALVAQMDVECVCTRAVEAAIYVTRADHGFLFQVEEEDGVYLCTVRGPKDRQARIVNQPVETGLAVQVAQSGKTVLQTQIEDDSMLTSIIGHSLGPTIATPLRWQRQTLGVLIASRDPGGPAFSETDIEWLNGLAEYAAIAVRNARAFRQHAKPAPTTRLSPNLLAAWQREITQLAAELRAATETVERLTALLAQVSEESS